MLTYDGVSDEGFLLRTVKREACGSILYRGGVEGGMFAGMHYSQNHGAADSEKGIRQYGLRRRCIFLLWAW